MKADRTIEPRFRRGRLASKTRLTVGKHEFRAEPHEQSNNVCGLCASRRLLRSAWIRPRLFAYSGRPCRRVLGK